MEKFIYPTRYAITDKRYMLYQNTALCTRIITLNTRYSEHHGTHDKDRAQECSAPHANLADKPSDPHKSDPHNIPLLQSQTHTPHRHGDMGYPIWRSSTGGLSLHTAQSHTLAQLHTGQRLSDTYTHISHQTDRHPRLVDSHPPPTRTDTAVPFASSPISTYTARPGHACVRGRAHLRRALRDERLAPAKDPRRPLIGGLSRRLGAPPTPGRRRRVGVVHRVDGVNARAT